MNKSDIHSFDKDLPTFSTEEPKILIDSINNRDTSLAMACLIFSAVLMVLGNLLADIAYSFVDPRIKVED